MNELFLKLVNMSISASWVILAVFVLRFILKKAPKWLHVLLWCIVAVRLICPFSVESAVSLIPSAQTVPMDIEISTTPQINSGINAINDIINPVIIQSAAHEVGASINPLQVTVSILSIIWLLGVLMMIIYAVISYIRLSMRVNTAVLYKDNIFQSENISSPFVLGIIKPKIYIPFNINEYDLEYVIAHEKAHIYRKDYIFKPFGFLLLSIYWFNPFLWFAYILLCRDIELACDESVIKKLDNEKRADYTQALVSCSISHHKISACPLAFGEVGIKERVKSIMNYKKPKFWIVLISIILIIIVCACFLTNPQTDNKAYEENLNNIDSLENITSETENTESVEFQCGMNDGQDPLILAARTAILEHNKQWYEGDLIRCASFEVLRQEYKDYMTDSTEYERPDQIKLYGLAMYIGFKFDTETNEFEEIEGSHIPASLTFEVDDDNNYKLLEYWTPRDGSYYADDIRDKFPADIAENAIDTQKYVTEQTRECYDQAVLASKEME